MINHTIPIRVSKEAKKNYNVNSNGKQYKILIGEGAGEFTVIVDDKSFNFNQEDSIKDEMIKLFTYMGYTDVKYEEWY